MKSVDVYRFSGQSSAVVQRTKPENEEEKAQRQQRLQGILQCYSVPTAENVMNRLKAGPVRLKEPLKAAWQAADDEEALLSQLFYAGFLTYSARGDLTVIRL